MGKRHVGGDGAMELKPHKVGDVRRLFASAIDPGQYSLVFCGGTGSRAEEVEAKRPRTFIYRDRLPHIGFHLSPHCAHISSFHCRAWSEV